MQAISLHMGHGQREAASDSEPHLWRLLRRKIRQNPPMYVDIKAERRGMLQRKVEAIDGLACSIWLRMANWFKDALQKVLIDIFDCCLSNDRHDVEGQG